MEIGYRHDAGWYPRRTAGGVPCTFASIEATAMAGVGRNGLHRSNDVAIGDKGAFPKGSGSLACRCS